MNIYFPLKWPYLAQNTPNEWMINLTQYNTPATYKGSHTARIPWGRPLRLFFYLFSLEILPNFNLVMEFWNETARVPLVIVTFPKFTLWFLWYLYHYNQNTKRTRKFQWVTHSRLWLKPLQTTTYKDLHKFCTTRATKCPIHALLKQNITAGSHITSYHRYIM